MVKIVRIPLTDIYDRDINTGKRVELPQVTQTINQQEKLTSRIKKKQSEGRSLWLKDWYIEADGLGIVKL